MGARQVGPLWTVEQYLSLERYSTVKHEYHNLMLPMDLIYEDSSL